MSAGSLAAVIVPAAPALLPGLGGAADPLASLREQARELVRETLAQTTGHRLIVIGAADCTATWPRESPSGAARFTTGRVPEGALPTSLEIGQMLAPAGSPVTLQSISQEAPSTECAHLGRAIAAESSVLIVVGDGPATLTEKAPGHLEPGAAPFARELRAALSGGDVAALAALDPIECAQLWMRGRPALQVLAGAFADQAVVGAEVLVDEAPFGVQYLLARWTVAHIRDS